VRKRRFRVLSVISVKATLRNLKFLKVAFTEQRVRPW